MTKAEQSMVDALTAWAKKWGVQKEPVSEQDMAWALRIERDAKNRKYNGRTLS